jgi:uncharacterized protein YndB with AHSA1/START domain
MSMNAAIEEEGGVRSGELILTRVIDAPREQVWKAWTEPDRVRLWHGPKGSTVLSCEIDLRVGGTYRNSTRTPNGTVNRSTGVCREIVPQERLVFTRAKGDVVPAAHFDESEDDRIEVISLWFEDLGGSTRMTLRHSGLPVGIERGTSDLGWGGALDKLEALVQEA